MRIVDIAVAFFIFNVAIGITNNMIYWFPNELGLLSTVTTGTATDVGFTETSSDTGTGVGGEFAGSVRTGAQEVSATQTSIEAVFSFFNTIWKGLVVIIPTIVNFIWSVLTGFITLGNLFFCGGAGNFCAASFVIFGPLQAIVYIIYGLGIAQWYSGRGFKEYY